MSLWLFVNDNHRVSDDIVYPIKLGYGL